MKIIRTAVIALILFSIATIARAASPTAIPKERVRVPAAEVKAAPQAPEQFYFAGEYGVSLGADVASADLENGRLGYSVTARAYPTLNWGIGLNLSSQYIDENYRVAPLLLWRLPVSRAALIAEAGPEYEFESQLWSLRVGAGPAFRLTKNIELSLMLGARKFFGHGKQDQSIESVTTAQVSYFFGGK